MSEQELVLIQSHINSELNTNIEVKKENNNPVVLNNLYINNIENRNQNETSHAENEKDADKTINLLLQEKDTFSEKIKESDLEIISLRQKLQHIENKLEQTMKQKNFAMKEKESMVIKYAVSEKNVMEQKKLKELFENKMREQLAENEILQHKVQVMSNEKSRICQMLDNKGHEHKTNLQELEQTKSDLVALENKLKWLQNNQKMEIQLHKDCQASLESYKQKLQESLNAIEKTKQETQDEIKSFYKSQENRAHVLSIEYKEQEAQLILLKHEKVDKDSQIKILINQVEVLHAKKNDLLQENNNLSVKVQQLERDRMENEQKLSNFRSCVDQQRQESADLQAKSVLVDQVKLQLKNEQENLNVANEHIELLKSRNLELECDMIICREREAEMLLFTEQLTDKNVKLQSEFTSMETKVQQLTCEYNLLKRLIKEQETKSNGLLKTENEEKIHLLETFKSLEKEFEINTMAYNKLIQELADQKGENILVKRKYDQSIREVNKELQQCRKKLENYESISKSTSSSNSSLSTNSSIQPETTVKVIQPDDDGLDRQSLIEHIVKLQRISARKSEKVDFLEEHVNTLVLELQKKTRLLQSYILRDQAGTMTSNSMDTHKANIAKLTGIMASVYSSKVADSKLSMELLLDINRKLQAVLEDALLKNMTLKESVDTLGVEIDKLKKQKQKS